MNNNNYLSEEIIDRQIERANPYDLNLYCDSEACYIATNEFDLIDYSQES